MTAVPGIAPGLMAVAAQGVTWLSLAAYSFAASTIIFWTTGQADYGVWATILAFRSALLFFDGGLAFGATRDAALAAVGDDGGRRRWRAAAALYVAGGLIALLLALAFAPFPAVLLGVDSNRTEISWVTALIGAEVAATLACSPVLAGLRGTGRFDLLAGSSLVTAGLGTVLLVALTPPLGLLGGAIAAVVARFAGALVAVALLRAYVPALGGIEMQREHLRTVLTFAIPMWAVAIGSAVGIATDVPIVGALFGASAAGAYGIGAVIPTVVAGLVFVLLDTAFPRLTTLGRASLGQVVRVLSTVGVLVAAIGFGALIFSAEDILTVWLGTSDKLAVAALIAYAVVWLLNVPTHVLVLGAIARNRHHVIGPVVLSEAAANVGLSVILALAIGPVGPAIATVVTVGVSNAVILPLLLGARASITPMRLMLPAVCAAGLGILVAAAARALVAPLGDPAYRVVLHAVLSGLAISGVGIVAIAHRSVVQRWIGILFDGGWRVLRFERTERAAMTRMLARTPSVVVANSPLVTIRIATYNRGAMVAERAIASALAQTHRNVEVVVVGDNCDAATERAVRGVRDRRVRFENLPQRGSYPDDPMFRWMVAGTAPMNRALAIARGEWLAPLDDDDEFTPDHVEILLEACRSRRLDLAYGVADMEVRPDVWEHVGSWPPRPGAIIHASVLYSLVLRPMEHNVEAWRLNEPGDWNLWRRMLAAGARFGFVDRVVVRHFLEYREVLAEATP